jgi:UDP-N-acetylmuramate: L-alanyl-gamma-D-glutamyl-meso-diaminopimelate ligase
VADAVQRIHFLGICGTAMAALAGSLHQMGYRVTGTDEHVYPPMSDHLAALGIRFGEGYRPENLPPDADLVIVGNVIRAGNPEAEAMRLRGVPYLSMAEAVQRFAIAGRHTVATVGTHGKTTTTALAAHVLVEAGLDPGFLIGGIARNFNSNFRVGQGPYFVIEGDEYDTAYFDKTPKFFKYRPSTLLFTSLEFDHADIYPDLDAIRAQFAKLLAGLPRDGVVAACVDDPNVAALLPGSAAPVVTYGFSLGAACRIGQWRPDGEGATFETHWEGAVQPWRISLPGEYNALNAAAVIVAGRRLGLDAAVIQRAFDGFLGVKRRQEERGEPGGILVIDDFAHHPTAIRVTLAGLRRKYAGRRLWAVFEPRSFTARSPVFRDAFPGAFQAADRTLIAPAFQPNPASAVGLSEAPAANAVRLREAPAVGAVGTPEAPQGTARLDSAQVAAAIRAQGGWAEAPASTQAILERLAAESRPGDVIVVMSNGGFEGLIPRLLQSLATRSAPA